MNPFSSIIASRAPVFDDPRQSEPAAIAFGVMAALAVLLTSLMI